MNDPEAVFTVEGRLATFTAHQPAKRRASSTRKKTPASLSWPHDSPDPDSLAKAGFYFAPSASSPDNVKCYICEVQLDGWESGDDPAAEHYAHKPECAWAITCHVRDIFTKGDTIDEDPMSDKYRDARIGTFRDSWPHENKKGWKCKVAKLVDNGWYHDPAFEADDAVSCAYCNLSIAAWEPKDDPMKEHTKRDESCAFYELSTKFASTRPAKGKKPRASRQSKLDRLSVQSTATVPAEMLSMVEPEDEDMNDTMLTTASGVANTTKVSKKKAKGRPKKKVAVIEDNSELVTQMTETHETQETQEIQETQDSLLEQNPPRKATRKTSRQVSRQVSAQVDQAEIEEPKPKKTRGKKKTAIVEESIVEVPVAQPKRAGRGVKRTSDGSAKEESLVENTVIYHTAPSSQVVSQGMKRTSDGAPKSQTTSALSRIEAHLDSSVIILEDPPSVKPPTRKKQIARTKKPKKESVRLPLAEIEPEIIQKDQENQNFRSSGFNMADTIASTPKQDTPDISPDIPSSTPSTPTPARTAASAIKRKSLPSKSTATPKSVKAQKTSSNDSPRSVQSSDAENKPPSARPSVRGLVLQPLSPLRPTQATPRPASPSKGFVNRLKTQYPWEEIDIDALFASFSADNMASQLAQDKENMGSINISNIPSSGSIDNTKYAKIVKEVKSKLTGDDRKMTIEQWIRKNGQKAHDKLRVEFETMITMFEREGANALRSLEGIEHKE